MEGGVVILYFIKKDILFNNNNNSNLSNFDLAVLLLLNKLYIPDRNYISCHVNNLYYDLFSKFPDYNSNKRIVDNIKQSINYLAKIGLIKILDNKSNCYVIDSSNLYIDTDIHQFISISNIELCTIINIKDYSKNCNINSNANYTPNNLLRYFLVLASTINNNSKIGFTSIDLLAGYSYISKSTALRYNSLLEDMKLIYIARSDNIQRHVNDNLGNNIKTIKKSSNTYGRFIDKDKIIENFKSYNMAIDIASERRSSNKLNRRSIKIKYNHFIKKFDNGIYNGKYKGNIEELYKECIKYNNSLTEGDIGGGMSRLDLSIFNGVTNISLE